MPTPTRREPRPALGSGHYHVVARHLLALGVVVVATSLAACSQTAHITTADRRAFCKVMRGPMPVEAREAVTRPRDEDAGRGLDKYVAAAEAVAPRDIRSEVSTYRREIQLYLRRVAAGEPSAEAQRKQEAAGRVVNDYVEDHCF